MKLGLGRGVYTELTSMKDGEGRIHITAMLDGERGVCTITAIEVRGRRVCTITAAEGGGRGGNIML